MNRTLEIKPTKYGRKELSENKNESEKITPHERKDYPTEGKSQTGNETPTENTSVNKTEKDVLLEIKEVGYTYCTKTAETEALRRVSFSVEKGGFVAVVGPSGCGKTTLLSLISGTISPTVGKVILSGNCRVGYMLQRDHLFEWRTVEKNLLLGPETEKNLTDETRNYVSGLIDKYGLGEFRKVKPRQLSGGMRQRAALIRTLATKPDLLLLDEPFSALDFQTRMKVCDDVYSIIKNEGKTALLVTHDVSEAISMADRIVVLSKRPATVRKILSPNFDRNLSPLMRRESPSFAPTFQELWTDISSDSPQND